MNSQEVILVFYFPLFNERSRGHARSKWGVGGGGRFPMAVLRSRICGRGRDFGVRWSDDEGKESKMGYVIS